MIYICTLDNDLSNILDGKTMLNSMQEVYRAIVQTDCSVLEITKEFAGAFFTPSGLDKFIAEVKRLNPKVEISLDVEYSKSFNENVKLLSRFTEVEDLLNFLLSNREDGFKLFKQLVDSYQNTYTEALVANNKLSSMHLELADIQRKLTAESAKYKNALEASNVAKGKLDTLVSKINNTYGRNVNSSEFLGIKVSDNRFSKILYIKEITRVHYVDTIIYYLLELLKILYADPSRYVVVEAPYAYNKINLYPNCKLHTDLSYGDVYNQNIMMAGFQPQLMKDILKNAAKFEYLIVLDRSGGKESFLRGSGIEEVYTCSDNKDLSDNISKERVIGYKEEFHTIPYIEDFDSLLMEKKLGKYSYMDTTKWLLDLLGRN